MNPNPNSPSLPSSTRPTVPYSHSKSQNLLAGLNAAQREAVSTLSGPLLVLAGAGTGKTRVITCRMAELIRRGTPPDRILSVTFTNKAAREMQERTAALLGSRVKQKPVISTFHSYCVRVLREEIEVLGYPRKFAIYDRGDQESAARTALRDVRLTDQSLKPGDLLGMISRWKMTGINPRAAFKNVENDLEALGAVAYRRYHANVKAAGAVDFDDLMLLTNQLFAEHPEVLKRQQARFDHVQIDEYQDTNGAQFQLVEALVRPHRNICVVGDDDQSIYAWRGAEVRHILGFENIFPGARVIRLVENYRCTDKILDCANRLVSHNRNRHVKVLLPNKRSDEPVRFREYSDEQTEAENVVREISFYAGKHNVPFEHFAILFRTNEQPRIFETELRKAKVPYIVVGSQSFFDRREIRDMLAYLKAIQNPADEISLLRIINTPARGIGTTTANKLLERAVRQRSRFWDAIPASLAEGDITPKAGAAVQKFQALLDNFRKRFEESPTRLHDVFLALLAEIDYESEIQRQYKTADQQLVRSAIVDQFADGLKSYCEKSRDPSLEGFLEETALMGRDEESDKDQKLAERAVKLMTLHSAKGLEFPRVYLVGLEEGLLPHQRSVEAEGDAIDEERRLAYVGITRAQDRLTVTWSATRKKWGKPRLSIPSRFLHEMQDEDGD